MNTVDAVEQLETYYGQYLPQLFVAAVAPIGHLRLHGLAGPPLAP